MPSGGSNNNADVKPFGAYHFTVEIDGETITYPFRSVSGLKIEQQAVDLEEGGFNTTTRKLVGRVKFPNIVLKRGFCSPKSELYKLKLLYMNDLPVPPKAKSGTQTKKDGGKSRISGVITQLGPNGSYVKWRFVGGFVCKWEGPDLDASKNEISIESIEIAHEGLFEVGRQGEQT